MTRLETLMLAVKQAETALLDELQRVYPVGAQVVYRLRAGVPEQTGEIVGHIVGREGRMRVRLSPSRNDSGDRDRYITTLPASKIVRCIATGSDISNGSDRG